MQVTRKGRLLIASDIQTTAQRQSLEEIGFFQNHTNTGLVAPYSEILLTQVATLDYEIVFDRDTEALFKPNARWRDLPGIDLPGKRKPYSYQRKCAQVLLQQRKFILALKPGSGKTLPIVLACDKLIRDGIADRVWVFSEPTIALQWADEAISRDSDLSSIHIWANNPRDRKLMLRAAIKRDIKFICQNYYVTSVDQFIPFLLEHVTPRDIIVLDECHNLKDTTTKRFKGFYRLIKMSGVKYVFATTGTPVSEAIEDFFGQACCIDDSVFGGPSKYYSFKSFYVITNPNQVHHVIGYRHVPEFMQKAHGLMLRLDDSEMPDLPPLVYEEIKLDMPDKLRKIYDDFVTNEGVLFLTGEKEPRIKCANALSLLEKSRQLANGWWYENTGEIQDDGIKYDRVTNYLFGQDWHNPKLDVLNDLLKTGTPAIIWYAYVEEARQLQEFLTKKKYHYLSLTRDVSINKRQEVIDEYMRGGAQILLSHPAIGGAGLNIQRAEINIFFNNQHSSTKRIQAEARSHRIGVEHKVTIYDIIWKKSVEYAVLRALKAKKEIARMVIDTTAADMQKLLQGEIKT